MAPHTVLGVSRSASVAEIKKAYARLLKQNRPDDDPVAFQALQQAYEACIGRARQRAERHAGAVSVEIASPPMNSGADSVEAEEAQTEGADEGSPGELPRRPPPRRPALFPPAPPAVDALPPRRPARIMEPAMPVARQQALFDQMLAVAAKQGAAELARWLQTSEDWYSLQAKEQGAGPLVERLLRDPGGLDLPCLQVLIEFFDLASTQMDPRLRQLGQRLFDREQFLRGLAEVKRRHTTSQDRVLWREMTSPRQRWRRLALMVLPLMPSRLRSLALQLLGLDKDQALTILDSEALDFWMPLTDPLRLSWMAVLSAFAQGLLMIGVPTAAVVWATSETWQVWAIFTGELTLVWMSLWLSLRGIRLASHHIAQWRFRRTGSAQQVVGGSIFFDPTSVIVMVLCASTVSVAMARYVGWMPPWEGVWVVVLAFSAGPFLTYSGGRARWETVTMWVLWLVLLNRLFELFVPVLIQPEGNGLALAVVLSALGSLVMDRVRAAVKKLPLPDARRQFNPFALLLAAVAMMGMLALPEYLAPSPAALAPVVVTPRDTAAADLADQDPSLPSVAAAFAAVRAEASPQEPVGSRFRDFHLVDGMYAGYWQFSGGTLETGPTRYAHRFPPASAGAQPRVWMRCEDDPVTCENFRVGQALAGREIEWSKLPVGGWRSFASPGMLPRGCECGPPRRVKGKQPPGTLSWAVINAMYNERGKVQQVQIQSSSGDSDFNQAATDHALEWSIRPGEWNGQPEGGVISVTVEYTYPSWPGP